MLILEWPPPSPYKLFSPAPNYKHLMVSTTQEMTPHMDITRWSIPKSDWLYSWQPKMEKFSNSQQKQDQELTVAQIMNSLQNSDLNWRK